MQLTNNECIIRVAQPPAPEIHQMIVSRQSFSPPEFSPPEFSPPVVFSTRVYGNNVHLVKSVGILSIIILGSRSLKYHYEISVSCIAGAGDRKHEIVNGMFNRRDKKKIPIGINRLNFSLLGFPKKFIFLIIFL